MVKKDMSSFLEDYVENMIRRLPQLTTATVLNNDGVCCAHNPF